VVSGLSTGLRRGSNARWIWLGTSGGNLISLRLSTLRQSDDSRNLLGGALGTYPHFTGGETEAEREGIYPRWYASYMGGLKSEPRQFKGPQVYSPIISHPACLWEAGPVMPVCFRPGIAKDPLAAPDTQTRRQSSPTVCKGGLARMRQTGRLRGATREIQSKRLLSHCQAVWVLA
jgi:hypothetical protein